MGFLSNMLMKIFILSGKAQIFFPNSSSSGSPFSSSELWLDSKVVFFFKNVGDLSGLPGSNFDIEYSDSFFSSSEITT